MITDMMQQRRQTAEARALPHASQLSLGLAAALPLAGLLLLLSCL
ncbi:hypothetical protein [Vannielia sp.]|nr:hypothetical protein [Vannielia sp.]MDF1871771.1 hypothetical protein [Vannielia sp.]